MSSLSALCRRFGGEVDLGRNADPELVGIELDSRRIEDRTIFAALSGGQRNGAQFVREAVERGACAVLTTPDQVDTLESQGQLEIPIWVHPAAREVVGHVASALTGESTRDLHVIGITGTNGKTSVAHFAVQLLEAADISTAELGTVGYRISGGREYPATHTTPDAPALQSLLAEHREQGGRAVVLEASSHALDQDRLVGTEFNLAIFTNLTRDHMDYHLDMDGYAAAKERLFAMLAEGGSAIVNANDPYSERMADAARASGASVVTYCVSNDAEVEADLRATDLLIDRAGTRFFLAGMGISATQVRVPLFGRHNVENVLAALAAALLSGVDAGLALQRLESLAPAPGRLEEVDTGEREFTVVVDYAHTEDALESVLLSAREALSQRERGRLICVFGCGGDRDRGKREGMGRVVGRLADIAVVTSDNPRTEAPEQIIADVWAGLSSAKGLAGGQPETHAEIDRRAAITLAIELARPDDVVLIAGKGHEATQEVNGVKSPFDDRNVVKEILA